MTDIIMRNVTNPKIPLLNNSYIINLVGDNNDVMINAMEIELIIKSFGLSTKSISIVPTCLSSYTTNKLIPWRIDLEKELNNTNKHVIINKIGEVNCSELIDLNRSIRALNMFRHPYTFLIDSGSKSRHKPTVSHLQNCNQINQIWPVLANIDTKVDELRTYISPTY